MEPSAAARTREPQTADEGGLGGGGLVGEFSGMPGG
jgi:hypothetical protein